MTRDDIIRWAREACSQEPREDWNSTAWVFGDEALERFAAIVAAHEREACIKQCLSLTTPQAIAEGDWSSEGIAMADCCVIAIRARGEK